MSSQSPSSRVSAEVRERIDNELIRLVGERSVAEAEAAKLDAKAKQLYECERTLSRLGCRKLARRVRKEADLHADMHTWSRQDASLCEGQEMAYRHAASLMREAANGDPPLD